MEITYQYSQKFEINFQFSSRLVSLPPHKFLRETLSRNLEDRNPFRKSPYEESPHEKVRMRNNF